MTLHDADGAAVRRVVADPLGEGGYLGVDAGPVDPRALLASRYYPDLDGDLAASSHTQPPQRAPGVTLASVDSKTWTSGTKHTWLKVALVDVPGEGNSIEKGDDSHSLSTQSAFVTMGNRSCSSCRVSG